MDSGFRALDELRKAGVISAIGVGINESDTSTRFIKAGDFDCMLLAGRYSLTDHSALPNLLPLCHQRGVRIALGGVFNSGILAAGVRHNPVALFNYTPASRPLVDKVAAVEAARDAFSVPVRAAALQFPLAHVAVNIVLLGAQDVAQWQDALAMMAHPIPAAFWDTLRARGLLPEAASLPAPR